MDVTRLKNSWQAVTAYGDEVPLFFYSSLFLAHPELRSLFPASMAAQRDRLVNALGTIVSQVDQVEELMPFLRQLGQDHRKFSVVTEHYPAVGQALLQTLAHFLGRQWDSQLSADWAAAYDLVAKTMVEAADRAAEHQPPWWEATVVAHERRTLDVAVMTVQPDDQVAYRPGQSLAVETRLRPNLWRYYSPANAPRRDGTIDLQVRVVDGGPVSSALVQAVRPGDVLRLGTPVGERLTLTHGRDIVMIAGGTGLAPFRALIEQVGVEHARGETNRQVYLFVGAPQVRAHYDLATLRRLVDRHPWLRVVPCVSRDAAADGMEDGDVVDVAIRHGPWPAEDFFVCGSPEMVTASVRRLSEAGISGERVHVEEFTRTIGPIGGNS